MTAFAIRLPLIFVRPHWGAGREEGSLLFGNDPSPLLCSLRVQVEPDSSELRRRYASHGHAHEALRGHGCFHSPRGRVRSGDVRADRGTAVVQDAGDAPGL